MTQILGNGISDNFLCRCNIVGRTIFEPFYSSFTLLFNFDILNWFVYELFFLFPFFFRLYGFGIQYKLTNFYNETRRILIKFQYLFGFSTVICTALQIYIPQAPACVQWDGLEYTPLTEFYASPSIPIVIASMLLFTISSIETDKKLYTSIGSIIVLFFLFLSSIFSGTVSFSQACLSLFVGIFFLSLYSFLPPIFVPVSSTIAIISGVIIFSIDIKKNRDSYSVLYSDIPGIIGCFNLLVNLYYYLRFVSYQTNYSWFQTDWMKFEASSSGSGIDAVIPSVLDIKNVDEFGKRLSRDIFEGTLFFICLLIFYGILTKELNYPFFEA